MAERKKEWKQGMVGVCRSSHINKEHPEYCKTNATNVYRIPIIENSGNVLVIPIHSFTTTTMNSLNILTQMRENNISRSVLYYVRDFPYIM